MRVDLYNFLFVLKPAERIESDSSFIDNQCGIATHSLQGTFLCQWLAFLCHLVEEEKIVAIESRSEGIEEHRSFLG